MDNDRKDIVLKLNTKHIAIRFPDAIDSLSLENLKKIFSIIIRDAKATNSYDNIDIIWFELEKKRRKIENELFADRLFGSKRKIAKSKKRYTYLNSVYFIFVDLITEILGGLNDETYYFNKNR